MLRYERASVARPYPLFWQAVEPSSLEPSSLFALVLVFELPTYLLSWLEHVTDVERLRQRQKEVRADPR